MLQIAPVSPDHNIRRFAKELEIPPEFQYPRSGDGHNHHPVAHLEEWFQRALGSLSELYEYMVISRPTLTKEDNALVVVACAPFVGNGPWTSNASKSVAHGILDAFPALDESLVEAILTAHIKPAFQANQHPLLGASTGRRLPPRGGALSQQDYLENQLWKSDPGLFDTLAWCLQHIEATSYERLWPLVVPPLMVFLDDFDVDYKILGVFLTDILLEVVSPGLLTRTGVGSLIFSCLKKCMTSLHNPNTPTLIRAAIPTSVVLISAITRPGSAERFDLLCQILGDGIIGSVWLYGSREPASIEATLAVLPIVIEALGLGIARFLKALVVQLVHPFIPENEAPVQLQLLSARALTSVLMNCPQRMLKWRGEILVGIARMWTTIGDSGQESPECGELKRALEQTFACLVRACPVLLTEPSGFPALLQVDTRLFQPLLSHSDTTSGGVDLPH